MNDITDVDTELCLAYQQASEQGTASRAEISGTLITRYTPLINEITTSHINKLTRNTRDVAHDLTAELHIATLEAAGAFNPSIGVPFGAFLRSVLERRRSDFVEQERPVDIGKSRTQVVRIYYGVQKRLAQELGREPTSTELLNAVTEWVYGWAKERVYAAGFPRDGSEIELEKLIEAKLRKQGMYAAMRELFSSVNARSSFTSLDATIDEDGETTLYDMLADPCGGDPAERTADVLSDPIWNMFTDMERACLLLKEGIVDGEALSYTQVGERLGVEWTEVRKHVASAKTKVVAPHAQYAYLSGSAEHQFEDNEKPHSAIERLRRRTVTTH